MAPQGVSFGLYRLVEIGLREQAKSGRPSKKTAKDKAK